MTLTRCGSGHFYDEDKFDKCPHCMTSRQVESETVALIRNNEVTVAGQGAIGADPVVGWLVCVRGNHRGEDFKLKTGRNAIGRATGMDIPIIGDSAVSRENHAFVTYDPQAISFTATPGDTDALSYLNGDPLRAATVLKANDTLTLGATKLMFFPCCSDAFNWDMAAGKPETNDALSEGGF